MSSTTLKLPEQLKARVAALVEGSGQSAHAFMVEAIAAQTERAERARAMLMDAVEGAAFVAERRGYAAREVHEYMRRRAAGDVARFPRLRSWRD